MKNQSGNDFRTKFCSLNSQEEFSEEIIWSCSDSSGYENPNRNESLEHTIRTVNRKRKRGKTRKTTAKNTSNLNITFVDSPLEHKNEKKGDRSPVIQKVILSPILTRSQHHFAPKTNTNVSPVLCCSSKMSRFHGTKTIKSPILVLNYASPKMSPNVRKKLFNTNNNVEIKSTSREKGRSISPVLNCIQIDKKIESASSRIKNAALETKFKLSNTYRQHIKQETIDSDNINQELNMNNVDTITNVTRININKDNLNSTLPIKTESVAVLEKVKSYFDSRFSSETMSQQSISEYDTTPKNSSKSSEEIEIINSQTDTTCMPLVIKFENTSMSETLRSYEFQIEKSRKVRYKKDGLAYRLSVLLKKQKATTSLWQHERFLAANSNFIIPNEDFTLYRIQNVTINYGCYIFKVIDVIEKKYFILINHLNMNSNNLEQCTIFKLYRPFKVLDFNSDYQLIVNVSKFECTVSQINII